MKNQAYRWFIGPRSRSSWLLAKLRSIIERLFLQIAALPAMQQLLADSHLFGVNLDSELTSFPLRCLSCCCCWTNLVLVEHRTGSWEYWRRLRAFWIKLAASGVHGNRLAATAGFGAVLLPVVVMQGFLGIVHESVVKICLSTLDVVLKQDYCPLFQRSAR